MAVVTVCSDVGAQENKTYHCFHFFPTLGEGTVSQPGGLWPDAQQPLFYYSQLCALLCLVTLDKSLHLETQVLLLNEKFNSKKIEA